MPSTNTLTIYHNPKCSQSREALRILKENHQNPAIIEYLKTPPDQQLLQSIASKLKLPLRALVRTGEPSYQKAALNLDISSDQEIADAICQYPALLQRPIIVYGEKAVIGRPPITLLELFQ